MYKRIILKLSGEAIAASDCIIDGKILNKLALSIKKAHDNGTEIAVVIGGGNIWRGSRQKGMEIERVRGDHMGMLATAINTIALQDALIKCGIETVAMSTVSMEQFCETYTQPKARKYLEEKRVIIIACGLGYPYFSTDTGVMLRAAELNAEAVLFAKATDGVYNKDPNLHRDAYKYDSITYDDIIKQNLKIIDQTAAAFGREYGIKTVLFALSDTDNIPKAASGENIGTIIQ